jgi:rhodanese-related sulfurtransferase
MALTVKKLMEEAQAVVKPITPSELTAIAGRHDVLIVDVRDGTEVAATGKVAGAIHVQRGLLEFKADPASPAFDPRFSSDKTIVLYCASGGRSALSGKTLHDMGYTNVRNLGGFKTWADAGGAIDKG